MRVGTKNFETQQWTRETEPLIKVIPLVVAGYLKTILCSVGAAFLLQDQRFLELRQQALR